MYKILAFAVIVVCGLSLSAYAAEPEIVLTDLDGKTTTGSLVEFGSEKVVVSSESGTVEFTQDKIHEIKSQIVPPDTEQPDEQKYVIFQLFDETRLVGTECSFSGKTAKITLSEGKEIQVPLDVISFICFKMQGDQITGQPSAEFLKIAKSPSTDDRLVAETAAVGSLNEYSGIILEVNSETVRFDLDGEIMPIPRRRVVGLIFRPKPENKFEIAICDFSEKTGSRLSVEELSFDKDKNEFTWKTVSGLSGTTPFEKMSGISFGQKNMSDLLQLTPLSIVNVPIAVWNDNSERGPLELLSKFSQSRVRVVQNETDASTLSGILLDRKFYSSGFTLMAKTDIVYSLPEEYQFLRGVVGIDDRIRPHGNVRLTVRGNDTVLFNETIKGDQSARSINVNIAGYKRIAISADVPEGISSGSRLNLVDMKLVK